MDHLLFSRWASLHNSSSPVTAGARLWAKAYPDMPSAHLSKSCSLLSWGHPVLYHLTKKQNCLNMSRQICYPRNYPQEGLLLYLAIDNIISPNNNDQLYSRRGQIPGLCWCAERNLARVQPSFPTETSLLAEQEQVTTVVAHRQLCIAIYCLKYRQQEALGVRAEEKWTEAASLGQGPIQQCSQGHSTQYLVLQPLPPPRDMQPAGPHTRTQSSASSSIYKISPPHWPPGTAHSKYQDWCKIHHSSNTLGLESLFLALASGS